MTGEEGRNQRESIPAGRLAEQRTSWLISTLIGSRDQEFASGRRNLHDFQFPLPHIAFRLCVHSAEVDVRRPGQQCLPPVPGLGHLSGGPHHLLGGIHPDSGSAGRWYDKKIKKHKLEFEKYK